MIRLPGSTRTRSAVLLLGAIPVYSFARFWEAVTPEARLFQSRVFLFSLLAAAVVVALWRARELGSRILRFLLSPGSALNLAVFRIVVGVTILASVEPARVSALSALAPEMIVPPDGLGWAVPWLLRGAPFAVWGARALQLSAIAVILGAFAGPSLLATAVLGTWIFGIMNFYGKVFHQHQCLVWFSLVLAASPCADRLSLRTLRAKGDSFHVKYGLPLKTIWLLIGMIYWFPGFWKVYFVGLDWIFGDHLKLRMYRQWLWLGRGAAPWFRLDQHPVLAALSAAAVLIFEFAFLPAIFSRRLRGTFAAGAFLFHTINYVYILYPFYQLRACLSAFVPWGRLAGQGAPPEEGGDEGLIWVAKAPLGPLVCLLVSALVFLYGATNTISWPFSAYPHFAQRFESRVLTPRILFFDAVGKLVDTKAGFKKLIEALDPVRMEARAERRLLSPDPETSTRELRAIVSEIERLDPAAARATRVQLFEETRSTIPEEWPRNPLATRLRATLVRGKALAWEPER